MQGRKFFKFARIISTVVLVSQITPARAELFFMSRTIGPSTNIYSVDEKGAVSKITDDSKWRDMRADVSSSGQIVFMSNRKEKVKIDLNKMSETYNIFMVEMKSKEVKRITDGSNNKESPVFSPDAKFIAYAEKTTSGRKLNVTDAKEKKHKTLHSAPSILDYAWSPDGKSLLYVSVEELKSILGIVDVDTGKTRTLLSLPLSEKEGEKKEENTNPEQVASAQWSPDGSKIAFITNALGKNSRYLKVLNLKSNKITKLSQENMHVQSPVDWSGDSQTILYSALKDYNYYYDEKNHKKVYEGSMQIFLTDLKTGKNRQVTEGNFLHNRPVFSPDEKKIAFLYSPELGARTLSLFTMKLDGSDKKQLYDRVSSDSILDWL